MTCNPDSSFIIYSGSKLFPGFAYESLAVCNARFDPFFPTLSAP